MNAPATRTALEQSFADLCEAHDLTSVSVHFTPEFQSFLCYAHAEPRVCETGDGKTIAEAIGNTMAKIAVRRGINLADEPLPMEQAA